MIKDFLLEVGEELGNDIPDVFSHLVGIILTSEATTDLSDVMIDIIQDSFIALSATFKISKSPTMVAVEGAAYRARQIVTDPYSLNQPLQDDTSILMRSIRSVIKCFMKTCDCIRICAVSNKYHLVILL
jgi:hypothetical protein